VKLSKTQYVYLQMLERNGGVAHMEGHKVVCGTEKSTNAGSGSFLRLVMLGAIGVDSGRLRITDYGRRLLA
jgi:hypothetical protein